MIRILLPYIFQLSSAFEPLTTLPTGKFNVDTASKMFQAEQTLDGFLNQSVFASSIRSSRELGMRLLQAIRDETSNSDFDREIQWFTVNTISNLYYQFKTVLLAELGVLPAFFVSQKQAYDSSTLLDSGEKLFPSDMPTKVPEAVFDAREAAKALAFELGTASAFHSFRVVESVLRKYYHQVTGGAAEPALRTIGAFTNALKDKADPRILSALNQLKDLHRNPTIHPEVIVTVDQAGSILGMAHSAVSSMLNEMEVPDPTTLTAIAGH
ncbi:hypothetical protein [Phyllobacterium chamaecytisi]|uniref:hypothetical protein n=1 Tax=Phyllobacterium chamaecytisi TaxID=2876082 RepID=UPI001CCC1E94|nr:hypothetical protein [Phyllobacterium sp. KW56]MBZ9601814.1 hypothetical protein [Phyllobacterium sp. KW56]